jgi:hypothetical protein
MRSSSCAVVELLLSSVLLQGLGGGTSAVMPLSLRSQISAVLSSVICSTSLARKASFCRCSSLQAAWTGTGEQGTGVSSSFVTAVTTLNSS